MEGLPIDRTNVLFGSEIKHWGFFKEPGRCALSFCLLLVKVQQLD